MRGLLIALVVVCSCRSLYAADRTLRLSLADAVRMAAEKNLDVRAELYNPAQYEAQVNRNRAIYDPQLNAESGYSDTTSPVSGSTTTFSSRGHSFQLNSSVSQLFMTGATARFGFNNSYSSGSSFAALDGFWQSNLGVALSQPLLKNAGREATEINISVARLSKFASLEHFRNVLLTTVSQVRTEYFKLYGMRQVLEVRKVSLALARKILVETKARVATGVLPAMEILNAEFGVTSREKDLIDAELGVSNQVDVLRQLLQVERGTDLELSDEPRKDEYRIDRDEALRRTLTRPDIKELQRSLDISELQTRVYRTNTMPDLSLNLSGSLVGQDHSYGRDLERIGSLDYPAWSVGVVFSYPLGNRAAENDYRMSRLKSAQTVLQIRNQEQLAVNEVENYMRAVSSAHKQIQVADRGRAFAEERLRSFMRKNAVGLATTKDVLDVENDLATAKNNQIVAAVAHDNAITRFLQATGELLEKEGIHVLEGDADRLYQNTR